MVSPGQVGSIEIGKSVGMLDTWVRLAGLFRFRSMICWAGVEWAPGEIELEIDADYEVTFEPFAPDDEAGERYEAPDG